MNEKTLNSFNHCVQKICITQMAQGFLSAELIIPMTNNHGYGSLEVLVG